MRTLTPLGTFGRPSLLDTPTNFSEGPPASSFRNPPSRLPQQLANTDLLYNLLYNLSLGSSSYLSPMVDDSALADDIYYGNSLSPNASPRVLGFEFVPRGLGSDKLTGIDGFSAHQIYINSVVAIVVSIVSLCATFVACYWFIRMKRSFRHMYVGPQLSAKSTTKSCMKPHYDASGQRHFPNIMVPDPPSHHALSRYY